MQLVSGTASGPTSACPSVKLKACGEQQEANTLEKQYCSLQFIAGQLKSIACQASETAHQISNRWALAPDFLLHSRREIGPDDRTKLALLGILQRQVLGGPLLQVVQPSHQELKGSSLRSIPDVQLSAMSQTVPCTLLLVTPGPHSVSNASTKHQTGLIAIITSPQDHVCKIQVLRQMLKWQLVTQQSGARQ